MDLKFLLLLGVTMIIITGCAPKQVNSEIFVMNTHVSQQVSGKNADIAVNEVNLLLKELEDKLSLYIDGSDIDKINKNAGIAPVKVDSLTFNLIELAKDYSKKSEGSFDVTIAPLTKLWEITGEHPTVPQKEQIKAATDLIDYNKIILDNQSSTIMLAEKGMEIDLGGIAKGYICGDIEAIYDKLDIKTALVSIGGNIIAYKYKSKNTPYTLGIRDPLGMPNDIIGKLKAVNTIVATSGGYERFFVKDNVTYHHILDTKTGYPANNGLLSVTVVSEDGALADFLSTTLFIAGKENINQFINHNKFSIIAIDIDKNVYISDKIKNDFEITNDNYKYGKLHGK